MEYNSQLNQSITSNVETPTPSPSVSLSSVSESSEEFDCFDPYYMLTLQTKLTDMEEEILLKQHGYVLEKEIGQTTQGKIFLASNYEELVAIKKISKDLHKNKQCIQNDFTFITDYNIVKEGIILKSISQKEEPA
eukprot:552206_1